MRRSLLVVCLFAGCVLITRGQNAGVVTGKVVDIAGAVIVNATVSLTDLTTGKVLHTTTGAEGRYTFSNVPSDPQLVTIEDSGFESFTQRISPATQPSVIVNATLKVATLAESIVVRGTVVPGARPMPTREDVMQSVQTIRVLDRKQLDAAGPVAGGAQMISYTPGANVIGYGNTGATKYTIQLNGIHQGWAGEATSFTAPGSLGITFDGVPITDEATGLWQSATMPQDLLMQNLGVTYGPGTPEDRWYTNVGGQVEFTPIQPTESTHFSVATTYGSYDQKNLAFVLNTGSFHGWSTVLGGGVGSGQDFRHAPDGFNNSGSDGSAFGKTIRTFSSGSFEFGGYYAKAGGYRPQVIPLTDQGIIEPNGSHYSEATSGFYSTMPFDAYNKYDTNEMGIIYGRENLQLNDTTVLQNMTWFLHIRRFHRRLADLFPSSGGAGQIDEWNNPHSDAFGDRLGLSKVLPLNTLDFGAYLIHELYNARNNFFTPSLGGDGATAIANIGGRIRSGYFNQDDLAFYAQDDFHPIPQIHITPGLRVVGFSTNYSDEAQRDFRFAPGVVLSSHCALNPVTADPYLNIFGPPNTTEQGSLCGSHQSRSATEPSIDVGVMPFPWLTLYGGYDVTYRSPSLGGGGGMFQKVDPNFYTLAKGAYSQGGVKIHFTNAPVLHNFILGVNYFHLDYTNQEIDFETAAGVQVSGGGSSTYHGVNAFFDDDPLYNLHLFFNFSGESANFTNYIVGGPSIAACQAQQLSCTVYNNLPVSYVPDTTLNLGVYYGISRNEHVLIEPRFWFNYLGSQHLFSNLTGAPSNTSMPSYTTANLSFTAPIKRLNLSVSMLNLFNSKYNEWEYISSGGYFGTPNGGYILAYPGAPFTAYGTISYQF